MLLKFCQAIVFIIKLSIVLFLWIFVRFLNFIVIPECSKKECALINLIQGVMNQSFQTHNIITLISFQEVYTI